jgi:MoaA/NifB/PqqE/SkfB family radical SAM enzyme
VWNLPVLAWRYWRADRRLGLPLQVGFAVNNTCNTFCEMCNVWQEKPKQALSQHEIRRIFGHQLFRHCATVSLTGGEPSMRKDFAELPLLLAEGMPALRQVNLTSNGYSTDAIADGIASFVPALASRGIGFSVNLSMDGVGDTHNIVRQNPRAWERLDATVRRLVELRRHVRFNLVLACTFTHSNVQDARRVLEYARAQNVYVIFRRAFTIDRIANRGIYRDIEPTPKQDAEIKAFLQTVRSDYDGSSARGLYYDMLLGMLNGADRSIPCLYRKAGLFVDHRGDFYVCTVFSKRIGNGLMEDPLDIYLRSASHRDELAARACAKCLHDVTLYSPIKDQIVDRIRSAITKVRR